MYGGAAAAADDARVERGTERTMSAGRVAKPPLPGREKAGTIVSRHARSNQLFCLIFLVAYVSCWMRIT